MYSVEDIDNMGSKTERWELMESREIFTAAPWVKVHCDSVRLPSGRVVDDYYRVELPEYSMICARREDGKVLFERQYKHGLEDITIVLPTGCIEKTEHPVDAAKRELMEETGYSAGKWSYIGTFAVDGNKGCGRGHFFIADDLEKISDPVDDEMEEAEIIFLEPMKAMEYILEKNVSELATPALLAMSMNPEILKMRGIK